MSLQISQGPLMQPDPCIPLNLECLNAITEPLLSCIDLDTFHLLVMKHIDMLKDGIPSNIRQFELSLVHGARVS